MISSFFIISAYDIGISEYFELVYKKELKIYGNKTYFSVNAEIIGLTALASISDIAIIAGPIQRLILVSFLLLAIIYSCRIIYLDWKDIIHFARKYYETTYKKTN